MSTTAKDRDMLGVWLTADYLGWAGRYRWLLVAYACLFLIVPVAWLPDLWFVTFNSSNWFFNWLSSIPPFGMLHFLTLASPIMVVIMVSLAVTAGFLSLPHTIKAQDWLVAYSPAELAARLETAVRRRMAVWAWLSIGLILIDKALHIAVLYRDFISIEFTVIYTVVRICCAAVAIEAAIWLWLRFRSNLLAAPLFFGTLIFMILVPEHLLFYSGSILRVSDVGSLNLYAGAVAIMICCILVIGLLSRAIRNALLNISR